MSSMGYDYVFKLMLVGNFNVGKTTLINTYVYGLQHQARPFVGFDFQFKSITIQDKIIRLQIWDTNQNYPTISPSYYKSANAVLLVYDMTDRQSFDHLVKHWVNEVENIVGIGVQLALIGNKSDNWQQQTVATGEGKAFAEEKNMIFLQASAKTGQNVKECFQLLARRLLMEKEKGEDKLQQFKKIDLRSESLGKGTHAQSTCW